MNSYFLKYAVRHGIALNFTVNTTRPMNTENYIDKIITEAYNVEIAPEYTPAFLPNLQEQPTQDSSLQQLAMIQTHSNLATQEKLKYSVANEFYHCKKTVPLGVCNRQKHEYLSLGLPDNPSFPIQIFGASAFADTRFVMRSELLLSIARAVGELWGDCIPSEEQDSFDRLLIKASALLREAVHTEQELRKPQSNDAQEPA
ncbi:hypothetical protein D3C73_860920 [compost metagenome]